MGINYDQGHGKVNFLDGQMNPLLRTTDRARAILQGIAGERDRVLQDAGGRLRDIGTWCIDYQASTWCVLRFVS